MSDRHMEKAREIGSDMRVQIAGLDFKKAATLWGAPGVIDCMDAAIATALAEEREAGRREGMRRAAECLKTVKSMLTIEALAPAVHDFEREKRKEAWAAIESQIAAILSEAGIAVTD